MLKTIVMIGIMRTVATMRGRDQVLNRVDGEGRERVDLLGDAHRPELGRHARAGARRDHERREDGRQLLRQRQADGRADEALLAEDRQRRDGLLGRHAPEKKPTSMMMGSEPTPTNCICSRNSRRRNGRRNSHLIAPSSISVCSPK